MVRSLHIHDVTSITVGETVWLDTGQYRNIDIESADGQRFRVVAFSDSPAGSTVQVAQDATDLRAAEE